MSLTQLQEKRGELLTAARERLNQINANTDESRVAELETQHDAAMAALDGIDTQIAREQKLADAEARHAASEERNRSQRQNQRPLNDVTGDGDNAGDADAVTYRSVFAKVACGVEVGDLSSEERSVLRSGVTAFNTRAQSVGTTTAGGFTVPTELANLIIKVMKDWGPMYDEDICTVFSSASGNPMKLPTVDDTAVTAEAHTENTALTDDGGKDVTFAQKSLDAYAFDTEFVRWSFELDSDSIFTMETLLSALLGERLGRIANKQLTTGTGSSAPNGIVTASGLGKTAAAVAAITADELLEFQHSVNAAYRRSPKCRWMFADTLLLAIRKLKDGDGNYLWQMGDVRTGAPSLLLDKPYSINDDMDSLAAAKKVAIFGDFSQYYVRKVGSPVLGVLRERFWPDLGIAGLIRFDGELGTTAAVKHLITAAS